jgi:hypothetical protein
MKSNIVHIIGSEVFKAVTMKNAAFWDVEPRGSCKNKRFGRTCRLHIQGRKKKSASEGSVSTWRHVSEEAHIDSVQIRVLSVLRMLFLDCIIHETSYHFYLFNIHYIIFIFPRNKLNDILEL